MSLDRLSPFGGREHFTDRRCEIVYPGARHDDRISPAMSFLSDAEEFAAIVLPELDVEMLALNLDFSGLDDVIHFLGDVIESIRITLTL